MPRQEQGRWEFSWQQPLGGGFGALANYTYADGHAADGTPLVGASKNTANGGCTSSAGA